MDLRDFLYDHLEDLQKTKIINEIGDCHEVMLDVMELLQGNGYECDAMCLYLDHFGNEPMYFSMDDVYGGKAPGYSMSTIENGSRTYDYVIHYVPVCGNVVIDLNMVSEVRDDMDFVYDLEDYIDLLDGINGTGELELKHAFAEGAVI